MRKLIAFLIKFSVVILFILLELLSFGLIVNNNGYQKSVFFSSSNTVLASLYEISNSVVEFFYLRQANNGLAYENTRLNNEIIELKNQLNSLKPLMGDSTNPVYVQPENEISYIYAKVIHNSTNKMLNYITLNKGSRDGIRVDMGVVNEEGVVGIVSKVTEKFSVVIPVLNPKLQINSKFKKNNYSGPIVWEGKDYRFAKLNDIARHVKFSLGDSLITSGYTYSFPEGILIGTVDDFIIQESDAYYNIRVKLAVNFRTLSHVRVINYLNYEEQRKLEQSVSSQ
ncbi:MAG: rod shape-determining protein MreC [Bacteroidales bacterium]|nr:rod shape-determining protein MreC [Bacteroidales bacterium]OJX91358.1 MAG: rod shape-determining protein MreC [Paludibacter sp. 47-17]